MSVSEAYSLGEGSFLSPEVPHVSKVWLIRSRPTYLWKVWKVQKALRKESQKVFFSLWEHQLKPQLDSETKDNGGQRQREETERTRALIKSSGLLTKSTLRLFLGFPFHFISSFFYLFPSFLPPPVLLPSSSHEPLPSPCWNVGGLTFVLATGTAVSW